MVAEMRATTAINGLEFYVSRFSLRKVAAVGLGAALLGSGLTAGLGAGVASAAPTADCKPAATVGSKQVGTWYQMTKEVEGGEVAPGGTVTFVNTYSGAGGILNEMRDYAPTGFVRIKAETGGKLLGLIEIKDDVTNNAGSIPNVTIAKGVWSTAANSEFVLKTTYRVPADLTPGTKIFAGGGGFNVVGLISGNHNWNPIENLCMTVREKNINEAIGGSLEDIGLGSVNTASANVFGSVLNPSGSIANVVKDLPLGDILGGILSGDQGKAEEGK